MDKVRPVFTGPFFNEFVVEFEKDLSSFNKKLLKDKILGPLDLGEFMSEMKNHGLICLTEANRNEEIEFFAGKLEELE
jgi:glycine dehydrogenase subunit 1